MSTQKKVRLYCDAHLWRDEGGLHWPRWMTPTELLWQLEVCRRGWTLHLQIDSLAGSS